VISSARGANQPDNRPFFVQNDPAITKIPLRVEAKLENKEPVREKALSTEDSIM
jgi:hypothetical protein